MKAEILSREELAERFNRDVRTITNWQAKGMPTRKQSGRVVFAWVDCLSWREEDIRKDERALRHAGGDEDRVAKMADAKLERAQHEAESARIDLAIKRGSSVPREFMRSEFLRIATSLRSKLLTLPTTWSPRLGACVTTAERQIMLQDAVNDLMPTLAELTKGTEHATDPAAVTA